MISIALSEETEWKVIYFQQESYKRLWQSIENAPTSPSVFEIPTWNFTHVLFSLTSCSFVGTADIGSLKHIGDIHTERNLTGIIFLSIGAIYKKNIRFFYAIFCLKEHNKTCFVRKKCLLNLSKNPKLWNEKFRYNFEMLIRFYTAHT